MVTKLTYKRPSIIIRGLLIGVWMLTTTYMQAQDYKEARLTMVAKQLEPNGIANKATLNAMAKVPRHLFVPERIKSRAYWDTALSIGEGQTISQPYIVAFMTQALQLQPTDRVLEIGTGSGYQAAVLGEIVDSVYTIEIVKSLGLQAKDRLKALGYRNVVVRIGDGYMGWPEKAPFNAIMVTAAIKEIPEPLLEQLAEGGRLIIPVTIVGSSSVLQLVTKRNGKLIKKTLLPVRFVPFTRDD